MICQASQKPIIKNPKDRRRSIYDSQPKVIMDVVETSDQFFEELPYSKDLKNIVQFLHIQQDEEVDLVNSVDDLVQSKNDSIKSLVKNAIDKEKKPNPFDNFDI